MPDVLIIDGEPVARDLLARTLEGAGLTVVAAPDGRAGIEAFRRTPAHVVVTELYLPDLDGLEVLVGLRNEYPALSIILISDGGRLGNLLPLEAARPLGAMATLTKPLEIEHLLALVREAVDAL